MNTGKQDVIIKMDRADEEIKFSGSYNGINFSGEFKMEGDTMHGKFNKIESEFEAESDQSIDSPSLMIIRAKLLDELKKMGFDFEGNPPKFSTGGMPWVITQPMKAFKKGGETIEHSLGGRGDILIKDEGEFYFMYSQTKKGKEWMVKNNYTDPQVISASDARKLYSKAPELKIEEFRNGGIIYSIRSFLNKKVTLEDFTK